jgi:hypothetical protein
MPPRHGVLRCVRAVRPKYRLLNVPPPVNDRSLNFLSRAIRGEARLNTVARTITARVLAVPRNARNALSKLGQARLPFLLSHVREEPHSIRDFVRVQGIDKKSGVAGDFMQSLPTAQQWNETAGNLGRGGMRNPDRPVLIFCFSESPRTLPDAFVIRNASQENEGIAEP